MTESESSTAAPSCGGCGAPLPAAARFCPLCGRAVAVDTEATLVAAPPVRAHWYGVTPPALLLGVSVLVTGAAIVLFAIGHWPVGLIVGGLALLLLAAFVEAARRRPSGRLAAFVSVAVGSAKAQIRARIETLAVQARAGQEATHIRLELRRLLRRRRGLIATFGETVYGGADSAPLRAELEALDARAQGLDRELHALAVRTRLRIHEVRWAAGGRMVTVPEPYPPPDEGDPPTPVITPEPLPPPDEGTPPRPDPVPTPGPVPSPAE